MIKFDTSNLLFTLIPDSNDPIFKQLAIIIKFLMIPWVMYQKIQCLYKFQVCGGPQPRPGADIFT